MVVFRTEVVAVLVADLLVFAALASGLPTALNVLAWWNFEATTEEQYDLERKSYRTAATLALALLVKLPAFALFLFALDGLSLDVKGAMCAVGVLESAPYGWPLVFVKVAVLYLLWIWLDAHRRDLASPVLALTRSKFALFVVLLVAAAVEAMLELGMFRHLETDRIVSCCGMVFGSEPVGAGTSLGAAGTLPSLAAFYGAFAAMAFTAWRRRPGQHAVASLAFLAAALLAIISVVSPYVYELPHHHCPFCLLQVEHHLVGYPLFAALFYGSASGISLGLFGADEPRAWRRSLVGAGLVVAFATAVPLLYFARNGVWL